MTSRHQTSPLLDLWRPNDKFNERKRKLLRHLRLEALEDRRVPAIFTVTNTNDSGTGSLRQAILDANATFNTGGVPDEIHFNIPGGGVQTIAPLTQFDDIIEAVTIDGYTQPGASKNTLAVGDNAVLHIAIDGRPNSLINPLLRFNGGDKSEVRGLDLELKAQGIGGDGSQITIAGNFIGTDPTGSTAAFGSAEAIRIITGAGNLIGGTAPADRNVIVGGGDTVIDLAATSGSIVQGNYIDVNAAGTTALSLSSRDVINSGGFFSSDNVIGGPAPGAGNVIVGGFRATVFVETANNVIRGNKIGTDVSGTSAIGNSKIGIQLQDANNQNVAVGGTNVGDGNTIAFNGGAGVFAIGATASCSILGNSIFANGDLGIDLTANSQDSVTHVNPNDLGDGDTGANSLQNYPVITSATIGGASTTVGGTLNSTPTANFRVEFFANNSVDPSHFGEGKRLLGAVNVATDASGDATFNATGLAATTTGEIVTTTATNLATNETSEFSKVFPFSTNPPAKVTSVIENGGAVQRSRVLTIQVNFDQIVALPANPASAFTLARNSDNAAVTLAATADNSGPGTAVTLTFTGGAVNSGSLADGRYTLTVLASQVSNVNGPLDGDGNGTGGDNFVLVGTPGNKLFRLFGDADGNGIVDGVDFGAFRTAFNANSDLFDFDGSGLVDGVDFGQFRQRFGVAI